MTSRYPIPLGDARIEFAQRNSLFIGSAGPAGNVDQAAAFVARVADEFKDAHHNAWAYLVGFGPTAIYACHNDGEPGGTAGPPALAALQGSGLGDVVVVVTRYFGGIKLGTGGLVRAYGRAAREVLSALPRGEHVDQMHLSITVDYRFHDTVQRLWSRYEARVEATDYGAAVGFKVQVPIDRYDELSGALGGATAGQVHIAVVD